MLLARAGAAVVDADHVIATLDEVVAHVRAEEAGTTGNDDPIRHDRPTAVVPETGPTASTRIEEVAAVDDGVAAHDVGDLVDDRSRRTRATR